MKEKSYFTIRKIAFWLFTALFLFSSPVILFYSLGYKFNMGSKKFIRTGTISIKTTPDNAQVYLNDKKLEKTTPCILPELFPDMYTVSLEKKDFYPYKTFVRVKPLLVTELNVILVPQIKYMQKLDYSINIYKFFFVERIFGGKIFIFSEEGIFLADMDFKNLEKLSGYNLGIKQAIKLEGVIEIEDKLLFWNSEFIWIIDAAPIQEEKERDPVILYKANRFLKRVFIGIRDKYVIMQDGSEVNALDINNREALFNIIKLKSASSEIYYDSQPETLYIKEKVPESNSFSIFRIDLFPSFIEKLKNEKTL